MCPYSCRVENRDGSKDTFDLGDFQDDELAMRAARNALLVSLSGHHVELWRERDLVGRLAREVAQFRSRNHPFQDRRRN